MINKNDFTLEPGVCGIQAETLLLVECALNHPEYRDILDLGTGTGYIGIVLDKKGFNVDAVDNDDKSIDNAKKNAMKFSSNVNIFKSDLFDNIAKTYDLIIFNPPVNPNENQYTKYLSSFLRSVYIFRKYLIPLVRLRYVNLRKAFIYDFVKTARKYIKKNGALLMHLTKDDLTWLSSSADLGWVFSVEKKICSDEFIVLIHDS